MPTVVSSNGAMLGYMLIEDLALHHDAMQDALDHHLQTWQSEQEEIIQRFFQKLHAPADGRICVFRFAGRRPMEATGCTGERGTRQRPDCRHSKAQERPDIVQRPENCELPLFS